MTFNSQLTVDIKNETWSRNIIRLFEKLFFCSKLMIFRKLEFGRVDYSEKIKSSRNGKIQSTQTNPLYSTALDFCTIMYFYTKRISNLKRILSQLNNRLTHLTE